MKHHSANSTPQLLSPRRAAWLALPFFAALSAAANAQTSDYKNPRQPLQRRLNDLMNRLTTEEKISLVSGTGFTTQPLPRLGIAAMVMADAGQDVGGGPHSTQGPATVPSGVAMASTWNPALVGRIASAIGTEAQNKDTGSQVMLGPAVNIHRSPLGGRKASIPKTRFWPRVWP